MACDCSCDIADCPCKCHLESYKPKSNWTVNVIEKHYTGTIDPITASKQGEWRIIALP